MNCIIVDDEPLGRRAIQILIKDIPDIEVAGEFGDAVSAGRYLEANRIDLVFLDIKMPGVNGLEFARTIRRTTLIIFTTAYAEYALDSYEVDAIDYLVKPIEIGRFKRAIEKARSYRELLLGETDQNSIESITSEHMFVKSERRYYKVLFKNILFIEGLKDYIIIQQEDQRIITKMTLKAMQEQLPENTFLRVNKSYIVNTDHIDSFDNNDIFIGKYEVSIGNSYRDEFFGKFVRNS